MRTDGFCGRPVYLILLVWVLFGFTPARAQATVWADDCAGVGTGTQGNPYCKIQTAICNIKTTGGTINVLPGTYLEAIRVTANINIISTDGPAVTTLNATGKPCPSADFCTIGAQPNCSAVYFPSAAGTNSRIEGIRITNVGGGIDQTADPLDPAKIGAGILVFGSSPTITRNEIVGNTISSPTFKGYYGGGIYINGLSELTPPRPVVTKNLIQGNIVDPPAGATYATRTHASGGGIYLGINASAVITGNTIKANRAGDTLKAFQSTAGGGVDIASRVTVVENKLSGNLLSGNLVADGGGAISLSEFVFDVGVEFPTQATLDNNIFESNTADDGGAIDMRANRAKIFNNTIHKNTARDSGGGVYFGAPLNPTDVANFVNNLVTSNISMGTSGGAGGGLYLEALTEPIVRFCDLWGNTPTNVGGAKTDASYIGLNGVISVDPLYVNRNAVPPDFHLLAASPVADVGDNTVAATLLTDYDGSPRIQDKDDNGVATVDMGAFEFSPDFDSDGIPDWQDPDQDDDGVPNGSDCAQRNRAISQVPDRVGNSLTLDQSLATATLKWLHAYQAPTYNVYRGTFGGGAAFAYNEVCFDIENATRTSIDLATPAPGTGYYYIVGSRNSCGESAAVTNSQGVHRTPAPTCATADRNSDGDTPRDIGDNCPLATNTTQGDVDGDSQGDACDNCASLANIDQADSDGDGRGNACDNCPTVANVDQTDGDGDGIGSACDNCLTVTNASQLDGDTDGKGDACDNCPTVANANQADGDTDGDGDVCDNCPTLANANQADGDADTLGDACDNCPALDNESQLDEDTDGDGDGCDNCPSIPNSTQANSDGDSLGNACDNCPTVTNDDQPDGDSDDVGDDCDNCPTVTNANQANGDGDNLGNACDNCPTITNANQADGDDDTHGDACDNCPTDANTNQLDVDGDGDGDVCDNCPTVGNADQANGDADVFGDSCDNCPAIRNENQLDDDTDGQGDVCDNCPTVANSNQANGDADTLGDACDNCPATSNEQQPDGDADDRGDACDNCLTVPNTNQANSDGDALGNACDACPLDPANDLDGDTVCGDVDNCPTTSNENQADLDSDGLGDACDIDRDGDSVLNVNDCAPDARGTTANPGEASGLIIDGDKQTLRWNGSTEGHVYGVYRGSKAEGVAFAFNHDCVMASSATRFVEEPTIPAPDELFYYLIAGRNSCGGGSLGSATSGPRPQLTACTSDSALDGDSDGTPDLDDVCAGISDPAQDDTDSDRLGNACDACPGAADPGQVDLDGDGLTSGCDSCPLDAENDSDADGACGNVDNCPSIANPSQADADGDAEGDSCDACPQDAANDADSDGACGNVDNCPAIANANQANSDGDNLGDVCDTCPQDAANDADGDDACGDVDNCPAIANANQANGDGDNLGDVCDNCATVTNQNQLNGDADTLGDACDNCPAVTNQNQQDGDTDGDGDVCDNCPTIANATQANSDGDTRGNACDNCPTVTNETQVDVDGDTVGDACDNCRLISNVGQQDGNANGVGDECVTARVGSWTTGLTHTVGAGNARLLVFMVGYEHNSDSLINSVTFGGQSLTRINGAVVGAFDRIELWSLKETGIVAASNGTFVVTFGGTPPSAQHFAAATIKNVDQAAPVTSSINSTGGSTPNPLTTSVAVTADGLAIAAAVSGNTGSYLWNNAWTEGTDQSFSSSNTTTADHPVTANGTDTASATHTSQNRAAIVIVSLPVAR